MGNDQAKLTEAEVEKRIKDRQVERARVKSRMLKDWTGPKGHLVDGFHMGDPDELAAAIMDFVVDVGPYQMTQEHKEVTRFIVSGCYVCPLADLSSEGTWLSAGSSGECRECLEDTKWIDDMPVNYDTMMSAVEYFRGIVSWMNGEEIEQEERAKLVEFTEDGLDLVIAGDIYPRNF